VIEPPEDPYLGPGADHDDEPPEDPQPAQDLAAERAVLGAVMLSPSALDRVSGVLTPDDFYRPSHGVLWARIVAMAAAGEPTDAVSVASSLTHHGLMSNAGGAPYLHTLIHEVPTAVNVEHWANLVVEKATLRRLAEAGMRIRHLAESARTGATTDDVVAFVRQEVELATMTRSGARLVTAATAVWEMIDGLDAPLTGVVRTPWPELDDLLNGGLRPGELIYVGARTSVGKSLVGTALAKGAAQDGLPVVMFSLEMTRTELMARLVADVGTVPLSGLIAHDLSSEDRDRAKRAAERVAEWPLWLDDTPGLSIAQIRTRCREMSGRGVGLVVVDYLGLMAPADADRRASRQEKVAGMSGQLKTLAKELECPVVALHQLNRGPEQRLNKRPQLSDFRESGATEQDADKVFLLWRPEDRPGQIVVLVEKHRNGPTGEVELDFHGRYARISSGDPYRNMGGHR
jgi:replicative DNA helicase